MRGRQLTVHLDLGPDAFLGSERWIAIEANTTVLAARYADNVSVFEVRCPSCVRSPEWMRDGDVDGQINSVDSGIVQSLFGTCEEPRDVCP